MWAILNQQRWNSTEFFENGVSEAAEIRSYLESLGVPPARAKALDFGCGVGRVTQALCAHFDEVCGVDISPTMIRLARGYNRYGERCRYILNGEDSLSVFPDGSFDFVYSNITLQHIEPRYTRNYLREFLRILRPSGVLLFQLPSEVVSAPLAYKVLSRLPFNAFYRVVSKLSRRPVFEMYAIRREQVVALLEDCGGRILDVRRSGAAGDEWISYRYAVAKGK